MTDYYEENLSAERLLRVYALASRRILEYLDAEIDYVIGHLKPTDHVLELGCGYGRVLRKLYRYCEFLVGIDTSMPSLQMARDYCRDSESLGLIRMNAAALAFKPHSFDTVVCIQNGISAFHVDQKTIVREAVCVTRPGGLVLVSTYHEDIWDKRLQWFEDQAREGLVGPIDYDLTGDGTIVCKDGFTATTLTAAQLVQLVDDLPVNATPVVVDNSSLFLEICC
ncbi:methyltransferase domain-containing protein [candidate division GN15 bacterium]|nr:methyltransferase domain-containing protein [candidate division GN15 bacterium]